VTDTNGCRNTDEVQVTVNPLPVITLTPNSAICINGSIQLNASGGTQYLWAPAGSLSNATISNPVASPTVTTTYTVTVTDGNGCVDSAGVTITVNPLPTVTVSGDTIICAGSSVTLTASGGVSYSWTPASSLNNANVSNPVATPSSPTTYTVTVTDANGCTNDGQVTVNLNAQPQASFTVDDANLAAATCLGYDGRLINTSVDALGYQWIFANGSTSTDPEPIVHFNLTGSNLITLVAINNFCRDTAVVDFTSTAVAQVFANMPNVITPNGDGNNDCYKFGNTIDLKECSQWKVFNRWGNEVFSASPSQPCWNGKKDNTGADLPVGTYFVVVVIEDQSYKGTITLLR
jgi:gliding motility-associated-like protein